MCPRGERNRRADVVARAGGTPPVEIRTGKRDLNFHSRSDFDLPGTLLGILRGDYGDVKRKEALTASE